MTLAGQILGTPAYMPPEQARGDGHQVDRTGDIYSLGVVLFELLTGELPFRGEKQMLLQQILTSPPPAPRKWNDRIPRDLETICLKCLEKDPRNRYPTAQVLADECQRFLDGKPVLARPVSGSTKAWRWCRRNPAVSALSSAVAVLLVSVAVVALIGLVRTRAALSLAKQRADVIEENLYFSQMTRAGQAALLTDGLTEVNRLIGYWRQGRGAVRPGWEWSYLNSLMNQHLVTLEHPGGVINLSWNPDGTYLASAGYDRSVRLWSNDGRQARQWLEHAAAVRDLAWNADGTLLASASDDRTIKIWQPDRADPVISLTHDGPVVSLSWNTDGTSLAAAVVTRDGPRPPTSQLVIWNATSWVSDHEFAAGDAEPLTVRWQPGGSLLALTQQGRPVTLIDAATGLPHDALGDKDTLAFQIAWSRDGKRLAVSRRQHTVVEIWDVAARSKVEFPSGSTASAMDWHPTRNVLLYADGNKEVGLRDLTPNASLHAIRGHLARVTAVGWHPNGRRLATGAIDGQIKIWEEADTARFYSGSGVVSWNPRSTEYASRTARTLLATKLLSGTAQRRNLYQHDFDIASLAWSPDGGTIASLSYKGEFVLSDAATGRIRLAFTTNLPYVGQRLPQLLAWSPDARHLVMPQGNSGLRLVDAQTGRTVEQWTTDLRQITALAWHPRQSILAVGGQDDGLRLLAVEDGRTVHRLNECSTAASISWSPDGAQLAAAESDVGVLIWSPESGEFRRLLGHSTFVHSVSWSPDGTRLASSDEAGSIRIWDPKTSQLALELKYPGGVPQVAWSSDSRRLAAVGFGGSDAVHLWSSEQVLPEPPYW
jgi:WD40 repeat protein